MNAKEARKEAYFNSLIDRTIDIENVLRIEIENAAAYGKMSCTAYIHGEHNTTYIIEKLRNDGFKVACECIQAIIGKDYKYTIMW